MIYSKLALANYKEHVGPITEEVFNDVIDEIDIKKPIKEIVLSLIIKDSKENINTLETGRYAFSGAIAPRIEDLILNGEIDKIKNYLNAVKYERYAKIMEALGITLDDNGFELLEKGILRSISELKIEDHEEER